MRFWYLVLAVLYIIHSPAWAWGRRGHSIVCQNAAYLVASEPKAFFLKNHSFDLGYYCNVPDLIWKEPPTNKLESFNHYFNREAFERTIGADKLPAALALDRKTFNKTYPQADEKWGQVYWRIREMSDKLYSLRDKLKEAKKDEQRPLQDQWLQTAGFLGHYVGDMSMPLHVTENHDGALTQQKGIHSFYEDVLVNELAQDGDFHLEGEVAKEAIKRWAKDRERLRKKTVLELLQDMTAESSANAKRLLQTDRDTGRDIAKAKKAHRAMIVKNLAMGSVYLAEFYRRGVGFDFDDDRFFMFSGTPEFVPVVK